LILNSVFDILALLSKTNFKNINMNLILVGINHTTAPIEVREKFYLNELQQDLLVSELKSNPLVVEGFVVSTCNRTEIYLHLIKSKVPTSSIIRLITDVKKLTYRETFEKYFYTFSNEQAIKHLLCVATGMDSLVLGEKQVFGQVKSSFERSKNRGLFSKHFNILSNIVIRAGKKAQTETKISFGGSSISWAAITKAEKNLKDLSSKSALIIGAGKMSELAVKHMYNRGFKKLYIMNRTEKNAHKLVEKYGGEVVPFCDIKEVLTAVDLCICSVGAPHYIIDKETVERVMTKRKENLLMFIDISMPRNIDPKVKKISNVKLYSIDDLDNTVEENMLLRKKATTDVHNIISKKIIEFSKKIEKLEYYQSEEFAGVTS
jgi:glutamyl-tRNA reductase